MDPNNARDLVNDEAVLFTMAPKPEMWKLAETAKLRYITICLQSIRTRQRVTYARHMVVKASGDPLDALQS